MSCLQEREFQNMFTFSAGFEAATLKIPNRELTSYGSLGGGSNRAGALPGHYGGSNDPYNLVTVNQGGVVVDGRDGTTSSWPAPPMSFTEDGHFVQNNPPVQPPRKQIIGFAKFRSRHEALEARDTLQGRRVDLEKGSVLKAEMAKKNLHTKRGPGMAVPGVGSLLNGAASMQQDSLNGNMNGLSGLGGATANGEVFMQREKELGALGPMGIALGQRRGTLLDDRQDLGAIGTSFGPRGARERAEEDERERERKRKEKEAVRLRQNTYAFEAFHSVPPQMVRQGANSLLSAENGTGLNERSYTLSNQPSLQSLNSQGEPPSLGPWGSLREVGASAALRKMTISSHAPQRPTSSLDEQESPTSRDGAPSPPSGAASGSEGTNPSATFSPDMGGLPLPHSPFPQFIQHARSSTPASEAQGLGASSSLPSSASSVIGAQIGDELSQAVNALSVSTQQGTTSPQLSSPSSGVGSSNGRNPGDQNPPVRFVSSNSTRTPS